jgi:prefoldin subunit 5
MKRGTKIKKKTDRFIREEADKEERKIQKMLQECEYLEQDMDEIQREYEERKQEENRRKKKINSYYG